MPEQIKPSVEDREKARDLARRLCLDKQSLGAWQTHELGIAEGWIAQFRADARAEGYQIRMDEQVTEAKDVLETLKAVMARKAQEWPKGRDHCPQCKGEGYWYKEREHEGKCHAGERIRCSCVESLPPKESVT